MIHLDPTRREEAIAAGWEAYAERVPGQREAYLRAASQWTAEAVCADQEVIGCLLSRDGYVHIGIKPEWRGRWASRRVMREILERGKKTTLMDGEDDDFIQRFGFEKVGGEYVVHR